MPTTTEQPQQTKEDFDFDVFLAELEDSLKDPSYFEEIFEGQTPGYFEEVMPLALDPNVELEWLRRGHLNGYELAFALPLGRLGFRYILKLKEGA